MITFPHTRTHRLAVRMKELTLGQAWALCELPGERYELTTTELLRHIAGQAEQPLPRYVTDPLLWTVEERTLLVCKYLAHVTTDGPNFAVGRSSNLSDYVMFDRDLPADPQADLGLVAGKSCKMHPLLGLHAQTLETLCKSRGDWIVGAIACQIYPERDVPPDWSGMSDVSMLEWVSKRIERIKALPESSFEELYLAYWHGTDALTHFFNLDFDESGLVFQAVENEGAGHPPARFFASSCISDTAKQLAERADQPGR